MRSLAALAAAALVAAFILGYEASVDGNVGLARYAVFCFGLGAALGTAGWLVYALREWRRGRP